jgi:hypothetical protein
MGLFLYKERGFFKKGRLHFVLAKFLRRCATLWSISGILLFRLTAFFRGHKKTAPKGGRKTADMQPF